MYYTSYIKVDMTGRFRLNGFTALEAASMDSHRIKVKLGDAEFDAEGKPEDVKAQYEAFLALVSSLPKQAAPHVSTATAYNKTPVPGQPNNEPHGMAPEALERIFRRGDNLSLAALPSGDNAAQDAMIALLYGYLKLQSESTVTGTSLMKSAKISGVDLGKVGRVDRVMAALIPDYVLAAGVKKAKRYQLNNRGLAKAEAVINAILQ
jgi:hypothetical protein